LSKQTFFFILLIFSLTSIRANHSPSLKTYCFLQESPKVAYDKQELRLSGLSGSGIIEIYSLIGNKIKEIRAQELYKFKSYLNLESGNMYIIRIITSDKIHTLKIIAS
jgi:hypothetical protein